MILFNEQCISLCPKCEERCVQIRGNHGQLHYDSLHQWNDKREIIPEYE
jgi:hypothetical protein